MASDLPFAQMADLGLSMAYDDLWIKAHASSGHLAEHSDSASPVVGHTPHQRLINLVANPSAATTSTGSAIARGAQDFEFNTLLHAAPEGQHIRIPSVSQRVTMARRARQAGADGTSQGGSTQSTSNPDDVGDYKCTASAVDGLGSSTARGPGR